MKEGDKVGLVIGKESPLGFAVLINEEYEGLLYKNEIFMEIKEGLKIPGYIKKIRDDGKIDVSLTPQGFKRNIDNHVAIILEELTKAQGVLHLSDKSSPQEIKKQLQMSKKNFKKALGYLYKQKRIKITPKAVYLTTTKG